MPTIYLSDFAFTADGAAFHFLCHRFAHLAPAACRALWGAAPDRFAQAFNHLASNKRLQGPMIILPLLPPREAPASIGSHFLENNFPITFNRYQSVRHPLATGRARPQAARVFRRPLTPASCHCAHDLVAPMAQPKIKRIHRVNMLDQNNQFCQ
ncbi:hypothetical protein RFM99_33255 [Mesorhizobium sp. VK4C]|uniref:hypothetical protein n=1 Tax=Mesorhizobium captivum TaxID=3072319 RepID=UPI002A246E63|nr:hypothetical protein [Mesorhizobium sp. VK4C]MDX8503227.1 hypothetical protein [Mesorhizobium sp. VK4C]